MPPKGGFWELSGFNDTRDNNPWVHGTPMAPFDQEVILICRIIFVDRNIDDIDSSLIISTFSFSSLSMWQLVVISFPTVARIIRIRNRGTILLHLPL